MDLTESAPSKIFPSCSHGDQMSQFDTEDHSKAGHLDRLLLQQVFHRFTLYNLDLLLTIEKEMHPDSTQDGWAISLSRSEN